MFFCFIFYNLVNCNLIFIFICSVSDKFNALKYNDYNVTLNCFVKIKKIYLETYPL